MGDSQGYNISRNDITDRVWVAKCDYSNDCGSVLAQGTSSANFMRSNLVYTGTLDNTIAVGRDSSGGICLDEDWMDSFCKKLKAVNESNDCDEVTVPPMRGFIEI